MARLISEAIDPESGTADPDAMSRGEPGLPAAFRWRGRSYRVLACPRTWKHHRREGEVGELYLRRHYYLLRMDDGSEWTVYCLRQPPPRSSRRSSPAQRWYLYSIE